MKTHGSLRRNAWEKIAERRGHFVFGNPEEQTLSSGIQGKFDKLRENMQNEIRLILYILLH